MQLVGSFRWVVMRILGLIFFDEILLGTYIFLYEARVSIGHNCFFCSSFFGVRDTIPCEQSGTIVNHEECLSDNKGYGKALGRWHGELLIDWNRFRKFSSR